MDIKRVLDFYREACGLGLSVSLSLRHLNGQESFTLSTLGTRHGTPAQNAATATEEDESKEDVARSAAQAPRLPLMLPECRCHRPSLALSDALGARALLLSMLLLSIRKISAIWSVQKVQNFRHRILCANCVHKLYPRDDYLFGFSECFNPFGISAN